MSKIARIASKLLLLKHGMDNFLAKKKKTKGSFENLI